MKEENKKEIKEGILTGVGTAVGAVIGAVVENVVNAADVDGSVAPEAEVVNAVVEELPETEENDEAEEAVEVETVSVESDAPKSHPQVQKSERIPSNNNVGRVGNDASESQDETEGIVDTDLVVQAEVETVPVAEDDTVEDEDIMVVSVESEDAIEDQSDICDAALVSPGSEDMMTDGVDGPDYLDMKDNDLNVGSSMMSANDMPDYVNDANIDSFTDNV